MNASGGAHSLCVDAGGAVWSFGEGVGGKLGHGDELDQLAPRRQREVLDDGAVVEEAPVRVAHLPRVRG